MDLRRLSEGVPFRPHERRFDRQRHLHERPSRSHRRRSGSDRLPHRPAPGRMVSNLQPSLPGLHQHIPLTPNPNRTLPVCDGGKNYYGWDYVTMAWKSVNNQTKPAIGNGGVHRAGGWPLQVPHQWVPCACGFRGNERKTFNNASSIAKLGGGFFGLALQSCDTTMAQNNNQGFLQLNGGQPPNHKITLAEGYTYTMTEKSAPPVQSDPPPFV